MLTSMSVTASTSGFCQYPPNIPEGILQDQNNLQVLDLLNPTGEVFYGEGAKIVV
jgi:hypothetical protein